MERKKEKKMTFSYFVSVSGGEPENMEGQKDMGQAGEAVNRKRSGGNHHRFLKFRQRVFPVAFDKKNIFFTRISK